MRQDKDFRETGVNEAGRFYKDLCFTCNHVQICTSKANRQGAVWFCEEFDDHVPTVEEDDMGNEFRIIPPWQDSNPIDTGVVKFKGLCINCENRNDCPRSRVEGGIWHCEEYC